MVYIDTFFSEVNADKSIILGTNVLVIEDPRVMQEIHNVHPSGFVTFESGKYCLLSAFDPLPHFFSTNVVSQGLVEVVAVGLLPPRDSNVAKRTSFETNDKFSEKTLPFASIMSFAREDDTSYVLYLEALLLHPF